MSLFSRVHQALSAFLLVLPALLTLVVMAPAARAAGVGSGDVSIGQEILVDTFEQPDLESRWDVMGDTERAEDAALFEQWGVRFGDPLDACIDCGGDPDVICGNVAVPESTGHLTFWADYTQLRMNGLGAFNLLRLLYKSTDGPEVLTVEHKLASDKLWVRIVGWDGSGPVASSPWAPLGGLDGSLRVVGFEIDWGPNPQPHTRGNRAMSLTAYDAMTETWPVSTGTIKYQSELTSYDYMVLGIDRVAEKPGIAGSLDIDDVDLRRWAPVPSLGH